MTSGISVDLGGKVALVTGASSGIGAAVVKAFARNGASVFVNYPNDTQAGAAEGVAEEIRASGGSAQTIAADVSDEVQVATMFQVITQAAGRLDILVNNAGIAHSSPVETLALSDFQRVMDVHVTGTFLCSKAAIAMMYVQEQGCIINTASQLAYIGAPAFSHYTAAKGAILSFTRSLALEVGSRNIPVNAVAPGATMTPILEDVPTEVLDVIKSNIPAGKIADVDDIVGAYLFLASDAARHFRGQCISPNGGDAFL